MGLVRLFNELFTENLQLIERIEYEVLMVLNIYLEFSYVEVALFERRNYLMT